MGWDAVTRDPPNAYGRDSNRASGGQRMQVESDESGNVPFAQTGSHALPRKEVAPPLISQLVSTGDGLPDCKVERVHREQQGMLGNPHPSPTHEAPTSPRRGCPVTVTEIQEPDPCLTPSGRRRSTRLCKFPRRSWRRLKPRCERYWLN